jgi:hypothetical protein
MHALNPTQAALGPLSMRFSRRIDLHPVSAHDPSLEEATWKSKVMDL